ncbi:MAG: DUF6261 family protein [Paludibacter sp.]
MKITLQRLSVGNLATLADRTITESLNEKYVIVKDHPLLISLQTQYEHYFEVFDKKAYSGKGKLVAKADYQRDEAFLGMKNCIYGLTRVIGNSMQQDAMDVYGIFKRFGLDLPRKSYMAKSGTLPKLIETLNEPLNKQKIENMHLTEIFELLSAAQTNFEKMEDEQITANAQLRLMESASSLRGNLEMALGNYFKVVTAMRQLEGWDDLYGILNEYVKASKNSHRKKTETTETENNA